MFGTIFNRVDCRLSISTFMHQNGRVPSSQRTQSEENGPISDLISPGRNCPWDLLRGISTFKVFQKVLGGHPSIPQLIRHFFGLQTATFGLFSFGRGCQQGEVHGNMTFRRGVTVFQSAKFGPLGRSSSAE